MATPSERGLAHNWGRWGAADQRGTANLLNDSQVADAAKSRAERQGLFTGCAALAGRAEPAQPPSNVARRDDTHARVRWR